MLSFFEVLKALALIRADRVSEAWPLIDEVESVKDDFDENTLQALCHCFKVSAEFISYHHYHKPFLSFSSESLGRIFYFRQFHLFLLQNTF